MNVLSLRSQKISDIKIVEIPFYILAKERMLLIEINTVIILINSLIFELKYQDLISLLCNKDFIPPMTM